MRNECQIWRQLIRDLERLTKDVETISNRVYKLLDAIANDEVKRTLKRLNREGKLP